MASFRRFKIGSFSVAGVCQSREKLNFAVVSRSANHEIPQTRWLVQCRVGLVDTSRCIRGTPQLLRGRFEPHCHRVLLPTVTIDISKNNCCFDSFWNDSDQRCANLHRASQGAPCSALKLGVLPQYHPEPMPAIAALRFTWSRKLDLKTFLKGNGSSQVFRVPCLKSRDLGLAESS